jgi:hypothetical protein
MKKKNFKTNISKLENMKCDAVKDEIHAITTRKSKSGINLK